MYFSNQQAKPEINNGLCTQLDSSITTTEPVLLQINKLKDRYMHYYSAY